MNSSKRVLITGSNGFVGSHLVALAKTYEEFEVFRGVRSFDSDNLSNDVSIDLTDTTSILRLYDEQCFDVIVHLAAKVGWGGLTYDEMYTENVLSTGALGYVAKKMGAQLLFASAALVHGQTSPKISLDVPVVLDTDYARTKYDAENLLRSILPNACIFRIGGVFGENGPCHLGLNRAISEVLEGRAPAIVGDGDGLRNYIYVNDLCAQILKAIRVSASGTYLIAGKEILSIKNMLEAICSEFLHGADPFYLPASRMSFDQVITGTDKFGESRTFTEALKMIRGSCT